MKVQGITIEYPRGESRSVRALVAASGTSGRISGSSVHDILPQVRSGRDGMSLRAALKLVGARIV